MSFFVAVSSDSKFEADINLTPCRLSYKASCARPG